MISSTIDDLGPEREAVDRVINEFEFERFRSESLPSISRAPREVCEDMARDCDLQILLIGERYGWVIPDLGMSVTEREYDVARASDSTKVLVFVKKLAADTREPRAKEFERKVTDFSTGLFRAAAFSTQSELAAAVKTSMSVWLSQRLVTRLDPSVAFNLYTSQDARQAFGALAILLISFFASGAVAQFAGVPSFVLPPPSEFWKVWSSEDGQRLLLVALVAAVRVIVSWILGILLAAILAVGLREVAPKSSAVRSFASPVVGVMAMVAVLFGSSMVGIDRAGFVPPILVVAAAFLGVLGDDRSQLSVSGMQKKFLSPVLAWMMPALIGLQWLTDRMGFKASLANIYFEAYASVQPALSWSAFLVAVVVGVVLYVYVRRVQASLGWAQFRSPK